MNSKIKNYVEVLFQDIPYTPKARELKEEILSNMNEHFESHIAEGQSENQAYTSTLADLGDIEALLADLAPTKEIGEKINVFKEKRAKHISIAMTVFFSGLIVFISLLCAASWLPVSLPRLYELIGLITFLVCSAVAAVILINIALSIPDDIRPYVARKSDGGKKVWNAISSVFWLVTTVVYFAISFATSAWQITWLIWLAAPALYNGLNKYFAD